MRINEQRRRNVVFMSRNRHRVLIGVLTGHWALNKHKHRMELTNSLVSKLRGAEKVLAHLLVGCAAADGVKRICFVVIWTDPE